MESRGAIRKGGLSFSVCRGDSNASKCLSSKSKESTICILNYFQISSHSHASRSAAFPTASCSATFSTACLARSAASRTCFVPFYNRDWRGSHISGSESGRVGRIRRIHSDDPVTERCRRCRLHLPTDSFTSLVHLYHVVIEPVGRGLGQVALVRAKIRVLVHPLDLVLAGVLFRVLQVVNGFLAHPRRAFEVCRPWRRLGPRRGRDNSCMCTGYFFCTGAGWRDSCLSIVSRGIL